MLHICIVRLNVMRNLKNFVNIFETKQGLKVYKILHHIKFYSKYMKH